MRTRFLPLTMTVLGLVGGIASILSVQGKARLILGGLALLLIIAGMTFYCGVSIGSGEKASCEILTKRPNRSLDEELEDSNEVWFCWHSGSVKVAQGDLFTRPRNIRLILTHPDSDSLREIVKTTNLTIAQLQDGIRLLTARVRESGGKVVWFDGPVQNSVILADPNSHDSSRSWARLEILIPFQNPSSRPSIRVRKNDDPEFFNRLRQSFEAIWQAAGVNNDAEKTAGSGSSS